MAASVAPSGLTKQGNYKLRLQGTNATYTGDTIINAGTLSLNWTNVMPYGTGKGNVTVNSGAVLALENMDVTINGLSGVGTITKASGSNTRTLTVGSNDVTSTFAGTIIVESGGLNLNKAGSGVLTLTGTNTFSGQTIVSNGQVVLANTVALSNSLVTVNVNNGLVFSNATTFILGRLGGSRSTASTGNFGLTNTAGDPVALIVGNSSNTGSSTFGAMLSGSGSLIKNGAAYSLRVQGTNQAYAGDTIINAGTLDVNITNWFAYGAGKGNVTNNGILGLRFNQIVNGLSGTGAVMALNSGTKNLTVGSNDVSSTFSGVISNGAAAISLTKVGSGVLTLTGSNTYTGATTVNGGTLNINGQVTASTTTVATAGTLGGTGVVSLAVTVSNGGTLSPGSSGPGTLTLGSNLVLSNSAVLQYELGTSSDLTVVGSNLTLGRHAQYHRRGRVHQWYIHAFHLWRDADVQWPDHRHDAGFILVLHDQHQHTGHG